MINDVERAVEDGYRPRAIAMTKSGNTVAICSFPYTDGFDLFVLCLTNPGDSTSWAEMRLDELVLIDGLRTPVVLDK